MVAVYDESWESNNGNIGISGWLNISGQSLNESDQKYDRVNVVDAMKRRLSVTNLNSEITY